MIYIYQKIFDLKSWLGQWMHSHGYFSMSLQLSLCRYGCYLVHGWPLFVWIESITWEGNTPRILKCFRCLGCRTMPHHYPRPTLSTCGPVILEGLCGARDDRCSICFIFFPYLLDSCSMVVSCFFHFVLICFPYVLLLLYIFRFFPTGELFTVGAAPPKNIHVFYGQYIVLLKWPEAYVIICVCNKQWAENGPNMQLIFRLQTSISMILTKLYIVL